jgi:hypothetical protein
MVGLPHNCLGKWWHKDTPQWGTKYNTLWLVRSKDHVILIEHLSHGNITIMFPNMDKNTIVPRTTTRNVIRKHGSPLQFILVICTYPTSYSFDS